MDEVKGLVHSNYGNVILMLMIYIFFMLFDVVNSSSFSPLLESPDSTSSGFHYDIVESVLPLHIAQWSEGVTKPLGYPNRLM